MASTHLKVRVSRPHYVCRLSVTCWYFCRAFSWKSQHYWYHETRRIYSRSLRTQSEIAKVRIAQFVLQYRYFLQYRVTAFCDWLKHVPLLFYPIRRKPNTKARRPFPRNFYALDTSRVKGLVQKYYILVRTGEWIGKIFSESVIYL